MLFLEATILPSVQEFAAALRVPLTLLWSIIFIKAWRHTASAAANPKAQRERGLKYFGKGLMIMAIAIIFCYNAQEILPLSGIISIAQAHILLALGSILNLLSACFFLTALDVSQYNSAKSFSVYTGISFLATFWVLL